ncbi:uncharacterized protein N7459_009719 [Penicillium hispanicum]|uniref:uncharacterized protein n=1 Tax=Penicillium hispanicum TaxID=1080232 RepID=UPI002541F822|nr:uncharacterized protein N7459_009719 [Penicillium hispanicum]KAJ5570289.1 hypothetical protein N7459_009719 [Penicillium hispanicum]
MPFYSIKTHVANNFLFQYFESTASASLTTFGHDPKGVGAVVIRMALVNDSPSAKATQAAELKISAINALIAASKSDIGPIEAIQHVAAGMLLCSFEIHGASCTSGQWKLYIDGVKSIIKASTLETLERHSEFDALLSWVYYHDTLLRFSTLHWHHQPPETPSLLPNTCLETAFSMTSPFTTTLELLSEGCGVLAVTQAERMPAGQLEDYKNFMKILGWRIRSISASEPTVQGQIPLAKTAELFQIATLVYLNRASGNLLDPPYETQQRIERAFTLFSQLSTCERQFPVFVLGCEARTDAERCVVLDLIARTEKGASSRSLLLLKKLIQAVWVQDDLAQGEVDYNEKLSAILSCCSILPTFV